MINVKEARTLSAGSVDAKKEIDQLSSDIEDACLDGKYSISPAKVSAFARKYLERKGYRVYEGDQRNEYITVSWDNENTIR